MQRIRRRDLDSSLRPRSAERHSEQRRSMGARLAGYRTCQEKEIRTAGSCVVRAHRLSQAVSQARDDRFLHFSSSFLLSVVVYCGNWPPAAAPVVLVLAHVRTPTSFPCRPPGCPLTVSVSIHFGAAVGYRFSIYTDIHHGACHITH